MPTDVKTIVSRVTDYGRKPTTPAQVLRQAHDLLAAEGRWIKGDLFEDGDPKEAYEKAACGKWGVCALGAIGIVSGEMPVQVERISLVDEGFTIEGAWREAVAYDGYTGSLAEFTADPPENFFEYEWVGLQDINERRTPLAHRAAEYLAEAIYPDYTEDPYGDPAESVVASFNDDSRTKRTQVLKAFRQAIEDAKGDPIAKAKAKGES